MLYVAAPLDRLPMHDVPDCKSEGEHYRPNSCFLLSRVSVHSMQNAILLYQHRLSVRLSVCHVVLLYLNE